ncbi:cellobiose transport system permease protein [Stackebrandtia albiflava]|uniref:Cellobiose transport system permease protein n=1 Tax=Stackebrandtia albiflava TaxID=406432 RepID=A0A562ULL0_9ACTN|nr:sugar ABC transporter permease [Stackebrandtia albiflava]TWJ06511.1 cellobiose transport system permease protein [Stackebrandtia albiflava]
MTPKAAHGANRRPGIRARFDLKAMPYLLISPYFLLFAVFGLFPLGFTLWVSLHSWRLAGDKEFIGFDNYGFLLTNAGFWNATGNTLGMFVMATIPQLVLAILLANALNKRMRGRLLYRMGILLPMVTSVVAVAIVFSQLFSPQYGMVNWLLETVGLDPVQWQSEKLPSWLAISAMVDWRWTGYNAIIFLAAMQTIPRDLYEAAAIDGASPRRQFWQITVPQLRPVIIFVVFISTMGGMMLFAEPLMFGSGRYDGGAAGQFQTIGLYIIQAFRERNNYGLAAAAAWLLFMFILIVAAVNYLFTNRIRGDR